MFVSVLHTIYDVHINIYTAKTASIVLNNEMVSWYSIYNPIMGAVWVLNHRRRECYLPSNIMHGSVNFILDRYQNQYAGDRKYGIDTIKSFRAAQEPFS